MLMLHAYLQGEPALAEGHAMLCTPTSSRRFTPGPSSIRRLLAQLFFPQSSPFPFPYVKFPQKFPRGLPLPPKFPLGEGGT